MFGLTLYNKRNGDLLRRNDTWDFRNIFDDFFSDSFVPAIFSASHPIKADIRETEKEYIIDAEIPGTKKEDIKLNLKDENLTILVEHNEETKEEKENYIRRERKHGSYSRSFYVDNVKNEDVTAKYSEGILTVILPKRADRKEPVHKINIQ